LCYMDDWGNEYHGNTPVNVVSDKLLGIGQRHRPSNSSGARNKRRETCTPVIV
jgi:hypothetical protein